MGVDVKRIRSVKSCYNNAEFKVEIEGMASGWHEQVSGIRQGCPLPPDLLLIVMTQLFNSGHKQQALNSRRTAPTEKKLL